MANIASEKIQLGISSCLLGEKVRFDGGHKKDGFIVNHLAPFCEFQGFCPEMAIGLGVPRETIRLVMNEDEEIRVVGTKNPDLDVTDKLHRSASEQQGWVQDLQGYIFKKDSPSCGMERVKFYKNNHPMRKGGVGQFAAVIMQNNPLLPIEEEGRLNDYPLRENFFQRVYIYREWQMLSQNLTPRGLVEFHSRIKYVLMSRSQTLYRELGRVIANIPKKGLREFAENYMAQVMQGLKKVSTRKNHVNVLQHIQGYLKKHIESDDKFELNALIDEYRRHKIPLIVPLTLLRHHFRKNPDDYIANSWYLNLYPDEMGLRNNI